MGVSGRPRPRAASGSTRTIGPLLERLVSTRLGETFNFYRDGPRAPLLRERLARYLAERADAPLLLLAEAPGYRGTRVSGIPLTSERQVSGEGPSEATATVVHDALAELGLEDEVLLWNVVPTHPGSERSNRAPTRAEVQGGLPFVRALAQGRRVIAVGRVAQQAVGGDYLRHPAHGGASAFRRGLAAAAPAASAVAGRAADPDGEPGLLASSGLRGPTPWFPARPFP